MDFNRENTVRITCAPGMPETCLGELEKMGFQGRKSGRTVLTTRASMHDCMSLNLGLRTAISVLYELKSFTCRGPDELYRLVNRLAWESFIPADGTLSVLSQVRTKTIDNTMFASLKVKDAIVDRISEKVGRRPNAGSSRDYAVVNLHWFADKAEVGLNTSGRSLANRGYRKIPGKAPLQETLAAGLLLASGYDGSQPLILPMCGTGTLAIEAAMIATNRPPATHRRNFGFMHLEGFDPGSWRRIRDEHQKAAIKTLAHPIIATDHDEAAIDAAQKNAQTAGVDHLIDFQVCDFRDTPIPEGQSIIVMNPPYGERLGATPDLQGLYEAIGDFLKKRCAGCTAHVLTASRELAARIGLRRSDRRTFHNGDIECRLLSFDLYAGSRTKA